MAQKPKDQPDKFSEIMDRLKGSMGGGSGTSGPSKRKIHFSFWYFIIALVVISWLQSQMQGSQVNKIPYSEFKEMVRSDRVESLVVEQDKIRGQIKDAKNGERNFITVRVEDPDLVQLLDEKQIKYSGRLDSKWLEAILSWLLPMALLILFWGFLIRRMGGGPQGMLSVGKARVKIFAEKEVGITFADVAGIDEAKAELEEIVEFLKVPEKFKRLGGRIPKGVLLVGAPGTGKTLLARAVAGEAGVPFYSMSGSEFVEMFVGVGAARVRDLFGQAKEHAPCIIFVDELDALGKARGFNPMGGHDEREQTLNQLLVEMDGFDPNAGVILMAATNRPEILDPALLRPGRFDRIVAIDKPDIRGREAILKIHAREVKLAPDVELNKIAALTPGFVGADLANLVNEAALLAARRNLEQVTMAEFQEAIDRTIGGLEKKNRVMNPKEKEIVAYHEAGHGLVAMSVRHADPVNKISIIPRGIAALGYTQQLPTEDRYLMTRRELLGKIDVLLGGRMAESIIFEDISTGAHNDLQRATDVARAMVAEYGMGKTLGLSTYPRQKHPVFLGQDQLGYGAKEYSEATAAKLDEEVKGLIDERALHVKSMLTEKKDLLEKIAKRLLSTEVIEAAEFYELAEAS